ncbi:MAG: ubiquinol oxidase subunit II [Desulfosarcina sp.]
MKRAIHLATRVGSLGTALFVGGCRHIPLLDPQGPIGQAERWVIIVAFALMLIVVVPVFIMVVWFPWRYRASNPNADYKPEWRYSKKIDLVIWLVPILVTTLLGILAWTSTHRLDPYKPIASPAKPVSIQAVALDWKWLFIYPDYGIASVGQLIFPAETPLSFSITSDTVMCSFFIPPLGSQIYAMAGRRTRLHLLADAPGSFDGHNQQLSGKGYADMHFKATATSSEAFDAWVHNARQSTEKLDQPRYAQLTQPSKGYPLTTFSAVTPGLFDRILDKYRYGYKKTGMGGTDSGGVPLASVAAGGQ